MPAGTRLKGATLKLEVYHRQERSVSWFAQKLCCERTNVYSIFKRKSIDTALLIRICQILHYDFFAVYSLKLEIKDQVATNPVQ